MGMRDPIDGFWFENPELIRAVAPWYARLENLELGILLLALPWIAGQGLRRADLERQLAALGPDLPVGPVYFQRVSRASAALEARGALGGRGRGRNRRFATTPEGFAALILNLRSLASDPTLDGSEFELKRSLVAMWNVVAERLVDLPAELQSGGEIEAFFARLEAIAVWGRPVVSDEVMAEAFDVVGLVERQRQRVRDLRAAAAAELERAEARARLVPASLLAPFTAAAAGSDRPADVGRVLETVRAIATHAVPALRARSTLVRYDAYLHYLDELTTLYTRELRIVDIGRFRAAFGRRAG